MGAFQNEAADVVSLSKQVGHTSLDMINKVYAQVQQDSVHMANTNAKVAAAIGFDS